VNDHPSSPARSASGIHWPFGSALDLADAIRTKQLSPREAVTHYLRAVDRWEPLLNAFTWRRDEALLADAAAAESQIMRTRDPSNLPPFFGVPIPIKDLSETLDQPVTQGSRLSGEKIGKYDIPAVAKIKEGGFLMMGRTTAPEFGTLPVTESLRHGATRNPWNTDHTPGGSSGGAAAAVAAGMAPIAHASDGGGSIRIPASCCGLVGLKPSRGRIPKGPYVTDIMHGFSTDGCVSTTIDDTAAMLDLLCHRDHRAWTGLPKPDFSFLAAARAPLKRRLRIGFTTRGPIPIKPSPICAAAVDKTAKLLAELGHDVFEASPDWHDGADQLGRDFITIWTSGTAYQPYSDWTDAEPINAGLRANADKLSVATYVQALLRMQVWSHKVTQSWGRDFDVLLTPTLAIEPPRIGWLFETGETDPEALLWRCTEMVPYAGWCNATGQPAISLPTFVAPSGLPVGVQLIADVQDEATLLQIGNQLEDVLSWPARLPR
jgi:amidase